MCDLVCFTRYFHSCKSLQLWSCPVLLCMSETSFYQVNSCYWTFIYAPHSAFFNDLPHCILWQHQSPGMKTPLFTSNPILHPLLTSSPHLKFGILFKENESLFLQYLTKLYIPHNFYSSSLTELKWSKGWSLFDSVAGFLDSYYPICIEPF